MTEFTDIHKLASRNGGRIGEWCPERYLVWAKLRHDTARGRQPKIRRHCATVICLQDLDTGTRANG